MDHTQLMEALWAAAWICSTHECLAAKYTLICKSRQTATNPILRVLSRYDTINS